MTGQRVEIGEGVWLPLSELTLTASRAGGPGGQHVNKVSTQVRLEFDLARSPSLAPEQKARIREHLAGRISDAGLLRVTCRTHRSQAANRREAIRRFAALVGAALRPRTPRRRTRVPAAERERRREAKRAQAARKRVRREPGLDD